MPDRPLGQYDIEVLQRLACTACAEQHSPFAPGYDDRSTLVLAVYSCVKAVIMTSPPLIQGKRIWFLRGLSMIYILSDT